MCFIHRTLAHLLMAGAMFPLPVLAQQAALQPALDFFRYPAMSAPALSPDGKQLAMRMSNAGKPDSLVVVQLATLQANTAAMLNKDVTAFQWVNSRRLVLQTWDKDRPVGDTRIGGGIYAIDRDPALRLG